MMKKMMKVSVAAIWLSLCIARTVCAEEVTEETVTVTDTFVESEIVASGNCGDKGANVQWTLDGDGTLTISGQGNMVELLDNQTPWRDYNYLISTVIVENGVTSIGGWNFNGCISLKSVTLPNGITRIGNAAFWGCSSLEKINIPKGVTYIGNYAFSGCNMLQSIEIPNGVVQFGYYAFENCSNLEKIILPATLTNLGRDENGGGAPVFVGCDKLVSMGPIGSDSNIEYAWKESIPQMALYNCESLKNITFSNGLKTIGSYAFDNCRGLENISFPSSLTYIDQDAFFNCSSLTNVYFPDDAKTTIEVYAFTGCKKLKCIALPREIQYIGENTFGYDWVDNTGVVKTNDFTIYGYPDTVAQHYALSNEIKFVEIKGRMPIASSDKVVEKFGDVDNKWYVNSVQYALDKGIMSGTSPISFEPDTYCTRTMMVQILWTSAGKQNPSVSNPFYDIKEKDWFYKAVLWALENGVTKGTSATTFGKTEVTREQMATFLMNYAKTNEYNTTARADMSKYSDANQISSWALESVKWAIANEIISGKGDGKLDPKGNATRAEVAQMVMSFQNKFGK